MDNVVYVAVIIAYEVLKASSDHLKFVPVLGLDAVAKAFIYIWEALQQVRVSTFFIHSVRTCQTC